MFSFRYHIATIVSVFLALALGLVLGGLIGSKAPVQTQDALVEGIQKDVAQTRETNAKLVTDNDHLTDFSGALSANWTAGRLNGKTILVLGPNGKDKKAVITAVEAAGGKTAQAQPVLEGGTWKVFGSKAETVSVDGIANVFMPLADNAEAYFATLNNLAGSWRVPVLSATLPTQTGDDSKPSADAQVSIGLARLSWEYGVAATDALTTAPGTYSVVALLTGAKPELYGTAEGADALWPPMPSTLSPLPTQE